MKSRLLLVDDYRSLSAQVETAMEHGRIGMGMELDARKKAADEFVAFLEEHRDHSLIFNSRNDLKKKLQQVMKAIPVSEETRARTAALMQSWEKESESHELYMKLSHQLSAVVEALTVDMDRTHIGSANPQAKAAIEGLKILLNGADPWRFSPGESDQLFLKIHLVESTSGAEKFTDLIKLLKELQNKLPPRSPGY